MVLDLVSLKGNAVHSEFCGVYGFGMTLGSPSFNVQGFVPILLKDEHGVSCTRACGLLGGAWSQDRYRGFGGGLSSVNVPWGQEFNDGPKFWSCASCLWVSDPSYKSGLLCPHNTKDKTPQLTVKQLSTARNSQSDSQSYAEKRRGRKELQVTRRRKGKFKQEESDQASNQPKWTWTLKIKLLQLQN